jgi:tetratricopeptide (TPR) repeat protein
MSGERGSVVSVEGAAPAADAATALGARSFPVIDPPRRDLLCALAYVYLACGQNLRALALLRLAERERPHDVGLLRVLAYALLASGDGAAALPVVERLEALDRSAEARAPLLLLRSHALRLAGHLDDARRCFREGIAARRQEGA